MKFLISALALVILSSHAHATLEEFIVRCHVLDSETYELTGSYFTVSHLKSAELPLLNSDTNVKFLEVVNSPIPWIEDSIDTYQESLGIFSFIIKKRPGMESSTDYQNSYEISGIDFYLRPPNQTYRTVVRSNLNFDQEVHPPAAPKGLDRLRFLPRHQRFQEKVLSEEQDSKKLGHITTRKENGKTDYDSAVRIQCEALSADRRVFIRGANY